MGAMVDRGTVRLMLPNGWMVAPTPAGLAGAVPAGPAVEGLAAVDEVLLEGPAGVTVPLAVDGPDGVAVLVERDGWLSWHLPEPTDRGVVNVGVPVQGGGPAGLLGDALRAKIRAVVYRFAAEALAGLAARAVVAVLEGRKAEGPVHLLGADPGTWLPAADLGHLRGIAAKRVLLLVHGTFSSTRGSFAGLGEVVEPLRRGYDLVLGYDHPTLGRSPGENAARIAECLASLGTVPERVDLVGYSRGGLVVRALLRERLAEPWRKAVGRVVFVSSPNAGTPLASPARWTSLLDRTTNMAAAVLSVASFNPAWAPAAVAAEEALGGLGVLLRALATRVLSPSDVPGLAAMDPGSEWLAALGRPIDGPVYAGIAVNHDPAGAVLRGFADAAADAFFQTDNDLVVPVASVAPAGIPCPVDVLPDASLHHLTVVRASADRLLGLLGIAPVAPGGLLAPRADDLERATAIHTVRTLLLRFPRELPDDVAERMVDLETRFPGILDEVQATPGPLAAAPPDEFSALTEARTLRRTVEDRFGYVREADGPATVGVLWTALASSTGSTRVVGSARALSQVSDPTGTRLLGTWGLGERWTDPPPPAPGVAAERLYWCGAGRTVRGVIGDLAADRPPRAIANIGSGSFQTVVGAFSSGTHGSGIGLGAIHEQVACLAVLTFAGDDPRPPSGRATSGRPELVFLEREDRQAMDPTRFAAWATAWARLQGLPQGVVPVRVASTERFRAQVLGLGCLGVIVGIGLWVVPQYWLVESRQPTLWSIVKHDLAGALPRHRHYELLLSPWPDGQGDHRCLVVKRDLTDLREEEGGRPFGVKFASEAIARPAAGLLMEVAVKDPLDRLPKRADTSIDESIVERYVDRWDQVLRLNLNLASLTGEYGVPADRAVDAIDALLELCRDAIAEARAFPGDLRALWRTTPVPAGPIAVRFVKQDDVHLSPMNGRDTAMLEFHFPGSWELDGRMVRPPSEDGTDRVRRYRAYHQGRKKLLARAERMLEDRFAARAHWGLHHTLDRERARRVYPGFDAWLAQYEVANASGRFNGRITAALGIDRP